MAFQFEVTTGVSFFELPAPFWRIETLFEDSTEQPNGISLCFNLKKTEIRFGTAPALRRSLSLRVCYRRSVDGIN
jgi:hypothetical protein